MYHPIYGELLYRVLLVCGVCSAERCWTAVVFSVFRPVTAKRTLHSYINMYYVIYIYIICLAADGCWGSVCGLRTDCCVYGMYVYVCCRTYLLHIFHTYIYTAVCLCCTYNCCISIPFPCIMTTHACCHIYRRAGDWTPSAPHKAVLTRKIRRAHRQTNTHIYTYTHVAHIYLQASTAVSGTDQLLLYTFSFACVFVCFFVLQAVWVF